MQTKLIALAVIAAGTLASIKTDIPEGASFEVSPEDAAELLGKTPAVVKLAEEPLSNQSGSKPAAKVKTTKVRCLMDGQYGKANDLAEVPAAEVKQLKAAGFVDDHADAVSWAEGEALRRAKAVAEKK